LFWFIILLPASQKSQTSKDLRRTSKLIISKLKGTKYCIEFFSFFLTAYNPIRNERTLTENILQQIT